MYDSKMQFLVKVKLHFMDRGLPFEYRQIRVCNQEKITTLLLIKQN